MKMEEQVPADSSQGTRKSPRVVQAVILGNDPQRISAVQVKQEPEEGQLQHWEARWQQFLRTVESPHPGWVLPQWSEEPIPWDDAEAFLASFEQVAEACQWPKGEWVARLLPALRGEPKQAFCRLEARDREDFGKVKAAILRRDALNREKQRQHFRCFCYQETEGPRRAYAQLQDLCHQWLKVERLSKEQILELLILEQFLTVLPLEIRDWVWECGPGSCSEAVALAEDFLSKQREAKEWEQQVLTKMANSGQAESAASCPPDRQLQETEMKQELEARLLGTETTGYIQLPEGGEKILEYSELVTEGRTSQRRTTNYAFQVGKERRISGDPPSAKRLQRNHPKNRIRDSIPGSANEILLGREQKACCILGAGFEVDLGLSEHKRVQNPDAEIQHTQCMKIQKDQLTRNQPIHILEKPHKCSSCGNAACPFFQEGACAKKRPFRCSTCGKCFSRNSLLIKHERTHGGEKPYTCATCGKSFVYNWNLIKHKKKHTGDKPHQCSACGKTFFERSDLIRHERTHTGEKPYRCSHCWRRFSQKWLLIKHERTHVG